MELNPTVRFELVGDSQPAASHWPTNVKFHRMALQAMVRRAHIALGVRLSSIPVAGGASKISDLKPMLAHLLPEYLVGCDFWGYLQEDQFLGDLRAFLDDDLLDRYDTISPLPAPYHHAGPFMVYRHTPHVDALYRRSLEWRTAATAPTYMGFDEWWSPWLTDHMPATVRREAAAGRIRAYVAQPQVDNKVWLQDDYVYAAEESLAAHSESAKVAARVAALARPAAPSHDHDHAAGAQISRDRAQAGRPPASTADRWYDETLLLTWRRGVDGIGRLWAGPGTDATGMLWDGKQGQRTLLHIMGSKHLEAFRRLETSEHLRRLAGRAIEFHVTSFGLWIKSKAEGQTHAWFSGHFPGVHALVRSSELAQSLARLTALHRPRNFAEGGQKAIDVARVLPCTHTARADRLPPRSAPTPGLAPIPDRPPLVSCAEECSTGEVMGRGHPPRQCRLIVTNASATIAACTLRTVCAARYDLRNAGLRDGKHQSTEVQSNAGGLSRDSGDGMARASRSRVPTGLNARMGSHDSHSMAARVA